MTTNLPSKTKLDGKIISALIIIGATIVLSLVAIFTLLGMGKTNSLVENIIFAILNTGIFILVLKKHYQLGAVLTIVFQFVQRGLWQNIMINRGNGYIWGLIIIFIGVLLLEKKKVSWGIFASSFLAFLSVLIDFLGPDTRPLAQVNVINLMRGFVALFIVFVVVCLIREWKKNRPKSQNNAGFHNFRKYCQYCGDSGTF